MRAATTMEGSPGLSPGVLSDQAPMPRQERRSRRRIAPIAVALLAVAAACSSGGDGGDSGPSTTRRQTTTTAAEGASSSTNTPTTTESQQPTTTGGGEANACEAVTGNWNINSESTTGISPNLREDLYLVTAEDEACHSGLAFKVDGLVPGEGEVAASGGYAPGGVTDAEAGIAVPSSNFEVVIGALPIGRNPGTDGSSAGARLELPTSGELQGTLIESVEVAGLHSGETTFGLELDIEEPVPFRVAVAEDEFNQNSTVYVQFANG